MIVTINTTYLIHNERRVCMCKCRASNMCNQQSICADLFEPHSITQQCGPQNITLGSWEFIMNMSLHVQLFEYSTQNES